MALAVEVSPLVNSPRNNSPANREPADVSRTGCYAPTLNQCSGTFRCQIPTGKMADSPGAAGSVSGLRPSETKATTAGDPRRHSLLVPIPCRRPYWQGVSGGIRKSGLAFAKVGLLSRKRACFRRRRRTVRKSIERRRSDSNRCIKVLQTSPLPLGYGAFKVPASL